MSYQVLARKWRPQRFSEVVGQQHVLSALENSLREGRLHHAYLFSGTRGVGKTSIARLFAKGLNCETGITATPCGECANCKAIAASRTKVEDTRELLDNVQYKPTVGRFKVYLIDEVHMLSRHSFNALLKTLEEPPEYVKFLLATTDPQKLPITILSRCMQFHLRALEAPQIAAHLEFILNHEQIPYEPSAVEKLAKAAQGSIRDALSLTDQAIAVSNADIRLTTVQQMLGLIDDNQPIELVTALAQADGEKTMAIVQAVAEKGVDWQQLLNDVAETLHNIAMRQLLKPHEENSTLDFLAKLIAPEEVQFLYQLMLVGKKELAYAPDLRAGVEMTLLRALAFHPKRTAEINQPMTATVPVVTPVQTVNPAPAVTTTPNQNLAQLKAQVEKRVPVQSVQTATPPVQEPQPSSPEISPALAAMQARKQLQEKQAQLAQTEKKKPEPIAKPIAPTKTGTNNLQSRLMQLAQPEIEEKPVVAKPAAPLNDEEYRWTWLNPELENQAEAAKPSDIKQAILQERTPELVEKTIALSCEQDEWCAIVNELKLGGLSRQVALNSYLSEKQGNQLQLVLKPNMAHLDNEESRQSLANALATKGFDYQLTIGESTNHKTPLEIRRAIFEQLTLDAKNALLKDEKLHKLCQAFDAEMDESTIRAVV